MASEITLLAEACGTLTTTPSAIWTTAVNKASTIKGFRFCHRGESSCGINIALRRYPSEELLYIINNVVINPYDTLHSEDGDEIFMNALDSLFAWADFNDRIDYTLSIFDRPQLVGGGSPE